MTLNHDTTSLVILVLFIAMICYVIYNISRSSKQNKSSQIGNPESSNQPQELRSNKQYDESFFNDKAREAIEFASKAAVEAYERQQADIHQQQAERRSESAQQAKATKAQRIADLEAWRGKFIEIVYQLGKPYFIDWDIDDVQVMAWADERAAVYIKKKPYILEIIKDIHADAQRSAEVFAKGSRKSNREIARERTARNAPTRNADCPYCGIQLDQKAHLDHIHPVQRGGPSESWNLVYVCMQCNHAKRDMTLKEFAVSDYAKKKDISLSIVNSRLKLLDKMVYA